MADQNYIRKIANQIRAEAGYLVLPIRGIEELFDTYAVLALSRGPETTDEDVHDAWSAWATKYDPDDDSNIPFNELSNEMKQKDTKYTQAICSVAKTLPEFQ